MDVVKLNAYHEWREHTDGRWYLFYDGENIRPSNRIENELINACRARWSAPAAPRPLTHDEIEDVRQGLLNRNYLVDYEHFHEYARVLFKVQAAQQKG